MLNIADEKGKGGNKYNDRNSGMEDEPDFTDPKGYVDEITDEGMMYAVCKRCYFENEQICFAKKNTDFFCRWQKSWPFSDHSDNTKIF